LSTKIHTTVDALGNPTGFHLSQGQACELDGADVLLPCIKARTVIADKGFDADQRVLEPLQKAGKLAVIPPKANRKQQRLYDKELYKARHLIEISSPNINSSAPSPHATTKPLATSSLPSISPPPAFGSFDDTP
jgi:transposase